VLLCEILGGNYLVDFDAETKKTQQINIKDMKLNPYRFDANIKRSIVLYNIAIGEIKKGNLDLAINDLKRSLSYNKGFLEAIKLMGLCYVNMKEYKKAEKIFKKLAKYEIYNESAKEYIQSLKNKKSVSETMKATEDVRYTSNDKEKTYKDAKGLRRKFIIAISVITVVVGGVIINYLFSSNIQQSLEKFYTSNKIVDSEEKTDENLDEDESSSEKNTIDYEDYENVQKNLENTKLELDKYKNKYNILTMLDDVDKSFKDGSYEKAASILISMKSMNFDDETKTKFDKLWQQLTPNVLWNIYNEGNSLYKQKKYNEALPKLKIASEIDSDLYLMPWITYQIGTCYKETNDNVNALIYFKQVKDKYPKSEYAPNAEMMINQIGN
jgi:tetratricopeptide (TPR) repeat protein